MTIARYGSFRIASILLGLLLASVAVMVAVHANGYKGYWVALLFGTLALASTFGTERLRIDFVGRRYCIYRLYASNSDYRVLPDIEYIGIRDVIYPGGREDSEGSWGDTYAYEVFLMGEGRRKLVVCQRSSARQIRAVVQALVQLSGARVIDRSDEKVTKDK